MFFKCSFCYKIPNIINNNYLRYSIALKQEDILHLSGRNGVGKTTCFNLLNGLLTPNEGEIVLDNKILFSSYKKINVKTNKRNISRVFQNYMPFPNMSVKKNFLFVNKNDTLLQELVSLLNIKEILNYYPYQLSGGQKQKISIIQSLISNPKLLLLDEPFSNLDNNTVQIIKEIILNRKIKYPIIIITHNSLDVSNFINKTILL